MFFNIFICLFLLFCVFIFHIVYFVCLCTVLCHEKWVPVTTVSSGVLRLRMEERPPIWRVAVNKLNKQSRTAEEGWSSSMGVGRGANNASPYKKTCFEPLISARCFLWRQNNPEVNYSPIGSPGVECFWRKYHAVGNGKGTFF
jgi:hypothetical protein